MSLPFSNRFGFVLTVGAAAVAIICVIFLLVPSESDSPGEEEPGTHSKRVPVTAEVQPGAKPPAVVTSQMAMRLTGQPTSGPAANALVALPALSPRQLRCRPTADSIDLRNAPLGAFECEEFVQPETSDSNSPLQDTEQARAEFTRLYGDKSYSDLITDLESAEAEYRQADDTNRAERERHYYQLMNFATSEHFQLQRHEMKEREK